MDNGKTKDLCMFLMRADSEQKVVDILTQAGYWDDPKVWRYYGDREDNFSTAGNQQSHPEAALVEKLVNSIDAVLMGECLSRGIDPTSPKAPQSINEAVSVFIENKSLRANPTAGRVANWPSAKRTDVSRRIAFTATGALPKAGNPCFTIVDAGEGQSPSAMPDTILSLDKKNKIRINFVQGKFNMGGTGALKFCGRHNLQFVLSRRNSSITALDGADASRDQWGFTVVRREDPVGGRRISAYTYLAPVGADKRPNRGDVARFSSAEMPIFPEGNKAYSRMAKWGTLLKLYEYSVIGHKSHILLPDGIFGRMDLLLTEAALPIRFHECREGYKGHKGSFETTMSGLAARLEDDKAENLEFDPSSCSMMVNNEPMTAKIFAFKKGKAETYRKREGIVFTVNGQTHGFLTPNFFKRMRVALSYLADSILVVVDCSNISGRAREDLFMNSRDRLCGCELRDQIETELEELLRNHPGLRELRERRRREEIESKLSDQKPLENILDELLDRYPTLSSLLNLGTRISKPFKPGVIGQPQKKFVGRRYPTFFRFKGKEHGFVLKRECALNRRCTITFETDAVNDYFERAADKGQLAVELVNGLSRATVNNRTVNLFDGEARLVLTLPDMAKVGDRLQFVASVTDPTRVDAFENTFMITVGTPVEKTKTSGERARPRKQDKGNDQIGDSGLAIPNVIEVTEPEWDKHSPPFDQYVALKIKNAGSNDANGGADEDRVVYDFFVNMDNVYLKSELKATGKPIQLLRARFKYGLVLIGLAILQDSRNRLKRDVRARDEAEPEELPDIEETVASLSRAVAPVILPAIETLGDLKVEDCTFVDSSGEDT